MSHQNLRLGKCWKLFRATLSEDLRFVVQAGLISHVTPDDLLQQPTKRRPH